MTSYFRTEVDGRVVFVNSNGKEFKMNYLDKDGMFRASELWSRERAANVPRVVAGSSAAAPRPAVPQTFKAAPTRVPRQDLMAATRHRFERFANLWVSARNQGSPEANLIGVHAVAEMRAAGAGYPGGWEGMVGGVRADYPAETESDVRLAVMCEWVKGGFF